MLTSEAATYLSDYSGISLACHKRRGKTDRHGQQTIVWTHTEVCERIMQLSPPL